MWSATGLRLAVAGLLVLAGCGIAQAERRVALVIGNGVYENTTQLANPPNDAADMAKALTGLGFDVITVINGQKLEMERALRRFARALDTADVALFFYAGHGLQVDGRNYMVPTNAAIESEQDLLFEAIELGLPVNLMETSGARVNLVILDACRNNPLARSLARSIRASGRAVPVGSGLAEIAGAAGTLIAFATKPGATAADGDGRNSPFTSALLRWIATPGLEVRSMFGRVRETVFSETGQRQIPWVNEALLGDFYFVRPPARETAAAPNEDAPAPVADRPPAVAALPPAQSAPEASAEPDLVPVEAEYVALRPTSVRVGPNVRAARVGKIEKGGRVYVAGRVKGTDWLFVERDDRPLGYVFAEALGRADETVVALAGSPDRAPPSGEMASAAERIAGTWEATYGRIELSVLPDGSIGGRYPERNGRMFGTLANGVLTGYWVEDVSAQRCRTAIDNSPYWGRFVFRFGPGYEAFLGKWGYCDSVPSSDWNGRRPGVGRTTAAAAPPKPSVPEGVLGAWRTDFGRMDLEATDDGRIRGVYAEDNGRIFGKVEDNVFEGVWVEDGSALKCRKQVDGSYYWGGIRFRYNEDFTAFEGSWGYCGGALRRSWAGTRIR